MTKDPAFDFYEAAWTAFVAGNIAKLEELTHLSPFPCATDGWVGRHWLTTAIHSGNPEAVAWVLSKRPDVSYVDDEGFTALCSALQTEVDWKHTSNPLARNADEAADLTIRLIDLLLDVGVDVNQKMTLDVTALHLAASWSSVEVVCRLLAAGSDPLAQDSDYEFDYPLDYAFRAKRPENATILRQAMERARAAEASAPDTPSR
jgi:Ankyrin repeats (many copies)/Ankyrin repeat